uniref:CEP170 C-terminal domain-containing protein n=1 Tax=Sinocyclocheilus rhinocerous TaxID=307959 RepID=A0A673GVY4_9TELE
FETNSNSKHKQDETQNEHFQNWSTHSAEIARLSQDLAKDLAILAREIHDVAGDGDSQTSSGIGATTSTGSMPNTPASTISTREEVHLRFASLNYQKVPPGSTSPIDQDSNMNDHDSSRRRPWNREEVKFGVLSVYSHKYNVSFRALFHNKTEVWEEIEAKINAENEVPILKTSNKVHSFQCNLQRPNIHFRDVSLFCNNFPYFASRKSHLFSKNCEDAKRGPRGPEGGRYVV